jgi:P27 family predicted phage terminase small subunit
VRPPSPLGPTGRALWRRVIADVPDGMVLDAVELEALEQACRAIDTAGQLEREAQAMGLVVKGSTGQPGVNPLLREARLQRSAAVTMLAKVKLTPPTEKTGHLSKRARDQLRDARAQRWPRANA